MRPLYNIKLCLPSAAAKHAMPWTWPARMRLLCPVSMAGVRTFVGDGLFGPAFWRCAARPLRLVAPGVGHMQRRRGPRRQLRHLEACHAWARRKMLEHQRGRIYTQVKGSGWHQCRRFAKLQEHRKTLRLCSSLTLHEPAYQNCLPQLRQLEACHALYASRQGRSVTGQDEPQPACIQAAGLQGNAVTIKVRWLHHKCSEAAN